MTLWQKIVGHDWTVNILASAVAQERLVHAYLITGPAQVGKSTLAWTFAQALNCLENSALMRPCGRCRACQLTGAHRHPDVIAVEGELGQRGKRSIKIGQLRELQQALNLTPAEGRYKVALLEDFGDANPNAANAFLKTLEEPPKHAIIILTAQDPDLLLPTITSRCQKITLRTVPEKQIEQALIERWMVDAGKAAQLAQLSGGRIGWAIEAVTDSSLLDQRKERLAVLAEILSINRVQRFKLAEKLSGDSEELHLLLKTWLSWWREIALSHFSGNGERQASMDQELDTVRRFAGQWSSESILRSLRQTETAIWQLERNANIRLVVENLLLAYPIE